MNMYKLCYLYSVINSYLVLHILLMEEAKKSSEWKYWEEAIKIELNQLNNMGTWKLVDKPKESIPISNKWVFLKKLNKAGEVIKYKAQLVAKGCSQRPGYDYLVLGKHEDATHHNHETLE